MSTTTQDGRGLVAPSVVSRKAAAVTDSNVVIVQNSVTAVTAVTADVDATAATCNLKNTVTAVRTIDGTMTVNATNVLFHVFFEFFE